MPTPSCAALEEMLDALPNTTLDWLSPRARNILRQLLKRRGYVGGAHRFARELGYRDRHHLRRALDRDGLVCLEVLAGWMRILRWTMWTEHHRGLSFAALVRLDGKDPAVCAHHVRELTGLTWTEVQLLGPLWVVEQLRAECIARRRGVATSGRGARTGAMEDELAS